jgi:hypothetical protein
MNCRSWPRRRAEREHLIQIAADALVHRHVTVQGRRSRAETDYKPTQPIAFADVSQRTINDKDVAASYESSALSTCGIVAIRRQVGDDLITNRLRGVMRDLKLSRILVVTRRAAVGFLDDALVERNFGRIGGKGIDDDLGGTIIVGRPALSLLRHGRIRASGQYKRTKDIKSDKLTPSHLVPSPPNCRAFPVLPAQLPNSFIHKSAYKAVPQVTYFRRHGFGGTSGEHGPANLRSSAL